MKISVLIRFCLIALFAILLSCKEDKVKDGAIILYNADDFSKKVKIEDTTCINQTKKAETDIKNGRYRYYKFYDDRDKGFLVNFLNEEDFKKLGIVLDTLLMIPIDNPLPQDYIFKKYCYERTMGDAVWKKYSKAFDSIGVIRGKEYVAAHPDEIYDMNIYDITDERVESSDNSKMKRQITFNRVEFENQFVYPKDYIPKSEKEYSHTTAEFIY